MANGIFVRWQGKVYDWGSINLNLFGSTVVGVDSIDIKHGSQSVNIYGIGREPIGYYNKNREYSAVLNLLYDQFQQIEAAAATAGLDTPMDIPPFSAIMQLGFSQDPLVPSLTLTLQNVRFQSRDFNAKQNTGGWYASYALAYAGLIRL